MLLKLRDLFPSPQVDALIAQLAAERAGIILTAGLETRPSLAANGGIMLPSGRSAIFRMLVDEILDSDEALRCTIVTADKEFMRIPRRLQRRFVLTLVEPPFSYADRLRDALGRRTKILVLDRLDVETLPLVLEAAAHGVCVLTQLDTPFRGVGVARHLQEWGFSLKRLEALRWVLAVRRVPQLCPICRRPVAAIPPEVDRLQRLVGPAHWQACGIEDGATVFYRATGCPACQGKASQGDVALVDIYRAPGPGMDAACQPSLLPMESYALQLALQGRLSLDELLQFDDAPFHNTFNLLVGREQALVRAGAALEGVQAELEAAKRVLQQRTQALFSLEDISQALINSTTLGDLAGKICRRARDLCAADKAILYLQRTPEQATALAATGWPVEAVQWEVAVEKAIFRATGQPRAFDGLPPGVAPQALGAGETLRAGLAVPLLAQDQPVGMMIVHSTHKPAFAPGEVALLQTFANQAALALQRAGLIEQLQAKIAQLEAAQAELAIKGRIESELALARQVQQSMLPRTFPEIPGYQFIARYESARQVGGDFYDVIWLDDDHFGVAIADVSDKGMPAALYMALTRSLLLAEARRQLSPQATLRSVNRLLLQLGEQNMFVTVFYGVVARATRRLTFARAGHDRPLLLRGGTALDLRGQGMALGLYDDALFHLNEEEVELLPGDRLVLYTDGLTDIVGEDGEPLGREHFKMILRRHASLPPEDLCEMVFADLFATQGAAAQFDDMTMLILGVEENQRVSDAASQR